MELREQWKKRGCDRLGAMDRQLPSWGRQCHEQTLAAVRHASLREKRLHGLQEQMPNGLGLVFTLETKTEPMSHCSTRLLDLFPVAMSLEAVASQTV